IDKVVLTAPATSATLTIANAKTLTVSNSLILAGTDATTMTFPGASDTLAGLGTAQTFSAANIFSANGAASTPTVKLNGSWFSGGTATTTKPELLIEVAGTATAAWNTSGTGLGVNAPASYAGNTV